MFPPKARAPDFGPIQIAQRGERDETLLPNEDYCARFVQICKAYTKRTSERWDGSDEMAYIDALIGDHIPEKPITVAGKPKIHTIYDAITSTLATNKTSGLRLPDAFYDLKLRKIVDDIAYEEEYDGYSENRELRTLGIGAMLGDVVERMVAKVEHDKYDAQTAASIDERHNIGACVGTATTQLWLHSTHHSTLGASVASLGADESRPGETKWPSYGSVLAIELFQDTQAEGTSFRPSSYRQDYPPISRTPCTQLSVAQKSSLLNYYVRLRYNNRSLAIPGCEVAGANWKADAIFCALTAFKEIVDQFTPLSWRKACVEEMYADLPNQVERAGFGV